MPSTTVCGTAHSRTSPDRATVELGVTHVAASAAGAMEQVMQRTAALEQQLGTLGYAPRDWSTSGVSLAEEWEWKHDTNTLVGHRATVAINVTVHAPDGVGELIRTAVDSVGAQIRNLVWQVDDRNPIHDQLRTAAALDARRRANGYATALGLGLGVVEEISELAPSATPAGNPMVELSLRSAKAMDTAPSMNAGEIDLQAQVYVRFALV